MRRPILIALFAVLLAGCGRGHPVAYQPIAYGENGHCYFLHSSDEVLALRTAGLCDPSWAPTFMPAPWHERYYPYYASPAYYRTYVPAGYRSTYVEAERSWGTTNRAAITRAAKTATYRGSNGKTVPASKIGAAKYGGGARFGPTGTKFGGGTGRRPGGAPPPVGTPTKTPASPARRPAPKPKAPSSGGKSSGRPSSGHFGGGGGRPSGGIRSGGRR